MRDFAMGVIAVALLAISACQEITVSSPSTQVSSTSGKETIHLNDAKGDLAAAWVQDDYRFIGMMGVGLILPGIDSDQQSALIKTFGVKIVDGITDKIDNRSRLIYKPAHDYAVKYNLQLLDRLRTEKKL